jgi:hypothetical protein
MSNIRFSIFTILLMSFQLSANCALATHGFLPSKDRSEILLHSKNVQERQTIADYFLAIPAEYLRVVRSDRLNISQRRQLLKQAQQGQYGSVYDISNGYLRLNLKNDTCGSYTITIFKRSSGRPLVARNISCTVGDYLVILDPDRNWQDVTSSILPIKVVPNPEGISELMIVLPRFGKTIEFYREENPQQLIGRYRFNGSRFIKI